ncbi:hypothetical protein DL765_005473 [Monosporascus sp. GIB2]|nr:hypothetical protein DL765_005473 [Monosporascus sp. GIB2]
MEDKGDIANPLSDAGLFFQHPALDEYDPGVPYFNPHLLLRPGAEMPKIERLSISDSQRASTKGGLLDEVNQGEDLETIRSCERSRDISSGDSKPEAEVYIAELQALAMMIERECGIIEGAKFPSLWQGPSDPHRPHYRHIIAGTFEKKPRYVRGGVLADGCRFMSGRLPALLNFDSGPEVNYYRWEAQIKR